MIIYFTYNNDLEKGIRTKGLGSLPNLKKDNTLKENGKFPIGTIRTWPEGDVIKKDEETWVPIEIPDDYYNISNEISKHINSIFYNKNIPIKSEKLINHLLSQYFEEYELMRGEFKKIDRYGNLINFTINKGLQQMWVRNMIDNSEDQNISIEKLQKLLKESKEIDERFKLEKLGLNDNDYSIYKGIINKSKEIDEEYVILPLVLKLVESLKQLGLKFKNDFVINEAITSAIEENFKSYKKKYEQEIMQDEGMRQIEEADLTLDSPLKEFYYKLSNRLRQGEEKEYINYALKVRYKHKLNKKLGGKILWDENTIIAVGNFENFVLNLPEGHVLKNPYIQELYNHSYTGIRDNSEGYAFYNQNERKISLSDHFLSSTSILGNLIDPNEFNSVIAHEIGHSVAVKLRQLNNLEYKRFVMYCGWDNRQGRHENFNATHGSKDIPRLGSYRDIPLLTKYSYQSPNECFAEYYSFYFLNKDKLNKWLETGKKEYLIEQGKNKLKDDVKESWIKLNEDKLIYTKKIPIVKYEKNEKGKLIKKIDYEIKQMTSTELGVVFDKLKLGYLYYRNTPILISDILKNYDALKQMKIGIFENEKLIKALVELGILK